LLIQIAAMLTGVAGPIVQLDHGEIPRAMSPLVPVLVTKGGRRPKSLDLLRSTPLDMDGRLRNRFASFSPEDFHYADQQMRGARGRDMDQPPESNRLAQICTMLDASGEMGANDPHFSDWEPDVYDRRLRTVLRPGFLLDNPSIAKLPALVANCHDSSALLPGFPLVHLARGGARAYEELFGLIAGSDVELPARLAGKSLVRSERGEIRCIIIADPSEIAPALEAFPSFANRVVLVDASRPARVGNWEEGRVGLLAHVYDRQVQLVADKRRRGHLLEFGPWSPDDRRIRLDNQAAFLNACDATNVACTGLEDLPAILRWTFDLIERRDSPPHKEVAGIIHRLCLTLLGDHVRILGAAQQRARLICQMALAEKLVGRIRAKQPVRQRDLIRTFDDQKVERYRPVLDLLVEEGVLVEGPRSVFRLGTRQLESVRSRWLDDPALPS
jgi:hypothetical protein